MTAPQPTTVQCSEVGCNLGVRVGELCRLCFDERKRATHASAYFEPSRLCSCGEAGSHSLWGHGWPSAHLGDVCSAHLDYDRRLVARVLRIG